jgi:four helix bundle protein
MDTVLNQKSDIRNQNDKSKFKKEFNQRLIKLSVDTIKYCEEAKSQHIYRTILEQLVRSITSIGANTIEAKASSSRKEYIKFFEIALKSANESLYWLLLLNELSDNLRNKTTVIYKETSEISRILAASILTLKNKN